MIAPDTPSPTLTEQETIAIDLAMLNDKLNDGYARRNEQRAMHLQLNSPLFLEAKPE